MEDTDVQKHCRYLYSYVSILLGGRIGHLNNTYREDIYLKQTIVPLLEGGVNTGHKKKSQEISSIKRCLVANFLKL